MKTEGKSIYWNYGGIVISLVANFCALPFLIYFCSDDYIGLWYLFLSIGGIAKILDSGFSPVITRFFVYIFSGAKDIYSLGIFNDAKNDTSKRSNETTDIKLLADFLVAVKFIYLVVGVILFTVILLATLYLYYFVCDKYELNDWLLGWCLYAFSIVINVIYSYYTSIIKGKMLIIEYNKVIIAASFCQIVFCLVFLISGFELLSLGISNLVYVFVLRFGMNYYIKSKTIIKLKIKFTEYRDIFTVVAKVWPNSWREFLISVGTYFNTQASVIICSMLIPLDKLPSYTIIVQFLTGIGILTWGAYSALQPMIQRAVYQKNKLEETRLLRVVLLSAFAIFGLSVIILYFVMLPILRIFNDSISISDTNYILLIAYYFVLNFQSFFASFISNYNITPYYKSFVLFSSLSLFLSFILSNIFDDKITAIVIGQIIAQVSFNFWYWPLYFIKLSNVKIL